MPEDMAKNRAVMLDVDAVLADRFPGKKFPRWVPGLVKRFIHQDWMNGYFSEGKVGTDFAPGLLEYMKVKVNVHGEENIPADGRFTFASNHPLGGVDAMALIAFVGSRFGDNMAIPANDFLLSIRQLSEYLVPVSNIGKGGQSRQLARLLDEAFASDRQVVIFPAQLCSRKIGGKVQDLPWKKMFIAKSRESGRTVIPVHFSGKCSWRFYFADFLRKALGVRLNFPMFLLPDELYRHRGKTFTMTIGKPIPPETFTPDKTDWEWAAWVRDAVYSLQQ